MSQSMSGVDTTPDIVDLTLEESGDASEQASTLQQLDALCHGVRPRFLESRHAAVREAHRRQRPLLTLALPAMSRTQMQARDWAAAMFLFDAGVVATLSDRFVFRLDDSADSISLLLERTISETKTDEKLYKRLKFRALKKLKTVSQFLDCLSCEERRLSRGARPVMTSTQPRKRRKVVDLSQSDTPTKPVQQRKRGTKRKLETHDDNDDEVQMVTSVVANRELRERQQLAYEDAMREDRLSSQKQSRLRDRTQQAANRRQHASSLQVGDVCDIRMRLPNGKVIQQKFSADGDTVLSLLDWLCIAAPQHLDIEYIDLASYVIVRPYPRSVIASDSGDTSLTLRAAGVSSRELLIVDEVA